MLCGQNTQHHVCVYKGYLSYRHIGEIEHVCISSALWNADYLCDIQCTWFVHLNAEHTIENTIIH